jgi:hypothetical protein
VPGVFRFSTDRFDAVAERENPHNPIRGEALLLWLRERLAPDIDLAPPEPDDWGWYASLRCENRAYTVGASGADEDEQGRRAAVTEWTVQVEKHRTLAEKLLRRARLDAADRCLRRIAAVLEREPGFTGFSADP